MRHLISALMIALIMLGTLPLALNTQPVSAAGTIYIRGDGSIDPPTAPIVTVDNVTYTLTGNVSSDADGIVVERDNIILDGDGNTVQGAGNGNGVSWSGRTNVTVVDTRVTGFFAGINLHLSSNGSVAACNITANSWWGIWLNSSRYTSVDGNTVTANTYGVWLRFSNHNSIAGNNVTANTWDGIRLEASSIYNSVSGNTVKDNGNGIGLSSSDCNVVSGNTVTGNSCGIALSESSNSTVEGNTVTANAAGGIWLSYSASNSISNNNISANNGEGIHLDYASNYNSISRNNITANINGDGILFNDVANNTICENTIENNLVGLGFYSSSGNWFYHNNLLGNHVHIWSESINGWDDGYPAGGNYWSYYNGTDLYSGPDQNQPGSDGIGDTPYVIDPDNQDHYPLMAPYPRTTWGVWNAYLGLSKTVVGLGHTVQGAVVTINCGNSTGNINITIHVCNNAFTFLIYACPNLSLESRSLSTVTFTWNTTGCAYGNYTVSCLPEVGDEVAVAFIDGWVVVTLPGDVDGDQQVNIFDIVRIAGAYGTMPPDPRYDPNCDINGDGDINIFDLVKAAGYYGDSW